MAGVRRRPCHAILETRSARMSLSRPRHGLANCWLVRLACATCLLGFCLLGLLILGGCSGSMAAPSGMDTTPLGTTASDDPSGKGVAGREGAVVAIERQPVV